MKCYNRGMIIEEIANAKRDFQSATLAVPVAVILPPDKFERLQQWAESTAEIMTAPNGSKRFIPGISITVGETILGMTILEPDGQAIEIR